MLVNRLQFHDRYVNFTPTSGAEQSADGFLKQVKAVIERNLDNNLFCVADLASGVCVSQAKLYRKLILLTGFSPNNYIRHVRLKHAAQLLSSGAANVGEVAWRVGFNSRSYFGKCFKAVHRCAPGKMINNVSSE
jgi:transcriptional regulator GlxA family with amidase domain